MNQIPFPDSHDMDDLNTWLDARVAGTPMQPANEVEAAADSFHALAESTRPTAPGYRAMNAQGDQVMQTSLRVATPPISHRTRRLASPRSIGRTYPWIAVGMVVALVVGTFVFALFDGPGRDRNNNIAYAPQVASPMADEPLNPADAPWIADFSLEDCTASPLTADDLPTQDGVEAAAQNYAVVGPASTEDATAVADTYRAMRGCRNLGGAFNYWSEARLANAPRVVNDDNRQELTELEDYFGTVYPEQFMAVATGLPIDPPLQQEWDLREEHGITGIPIPMAARLNPAWGVELSDGRIAFPATIMYAANDPAIVASGLPIDRPDSTVAMVFTFEDDAWKYDDSLLLCIVNCDYGVGSPVEPSGNAWARPADPEQCTVAPITSDEYRDRLSEFPGYTDRSYTIAGDPDEEDTADAARAGQSLLDCSLERTSFVVEALLTDLGLHHYRFTQQSTVPRTPELAGYLRQWDLGGRNLMLTSDYVMRIAVVDGPVTPYTPDGSTWEPIPFDLSSRNVASTHSLEYSFDPATGILLGDGRIAFGATQLIALDSRAAVTYEGNAWQWFAGWTVLQETDEGWLIDELLYTHRDYLVVEEKNGWWWQPQYDATPVATPEVASPIAEEQLVWTAPISPAECPEDEVIPSYDPDNPSGVLYTQEDYDQVSSERDYTITGAAEPGNANAVVGRMREVQGCTVYARQLAWWSARFEYENRTTAGRNSLEAISDQRTSAADVVATWYEDELSLSPADMWVEQDPADLTLDGSEALVTQALYNPDHAVQFADGRIGIIHSVVTYDPVEHEIAPWYSPSMSIFVYQDGQWMLDETLPICFGDCKAMATPVTTGDDIAYPFSTPITTPQ